MRSLVAFWVTMFLAGVLLGCILQAHGVTPFTNVAAQQVQQAQQAGSVAVYAGPLRDGNGSRRACSFLDGIYNMRGEIANNVIIVTDPLNIEYYRSEHIAQLDDYAIQQITCLRSAQTGTLVLTLGGFPIGGGGQQAITLATPYFIHQPVAYEEYLAGQR